MKEGEPQINFEGDPEEEKEQTPEEILSSLEKAIEDGSKAELTVLCLDGESSTAATVFPVEFEGNDVLWLETEKGEGMSIEVSRIKRVELFSEPEEERGETEGEE